MTTQPKSLDPFCCDLSLASDEAMFGTAPTIKTWFMLEYNGAWKRKATEQNALPGSVQAWLQAQLALASDSRLIFIKKNRPVSTTRTTFFVALSRETSSRLYRFILDDFESLLNLNLEAVLRDDPAAERHLYLEPLYLVCTNGKRDRCCAREGPALYQALANIAGDNAWQCTHLGGHRFAPTLVTLPDGAFYGRLDPAEATSLVRSNEQGALLLEKLRGRCIYEPVSQAAEQFLRQETGMRQRTAYLLQDVERLDQSQWAVTFRQADGGIRRIILSQETPIDRLVSCSPMKTKEVFQFRLG